MKSLLIFNFQNQPTDKGQRTNYHYRTKCKCCEFDTIKVTTQKKLGGRHGSRTEVSSCILMLESRK